MKPLLILLTPLTLAESPYTPISYTGGINNYDEQEQIAGYPHRTPACKMLINGDLNHSINQQISGIFAALIDNESVIMLENAGRANMRGMRITKKGNSQFPQESLGQGLNAAIRCQSSSWLKLSNSLVSTRGSYASAIYIGGSHSQVILDDVHLSTWQGYSPALIATKGALAIGTRIELRTQGMNSPALMVEDMGQLLLDKIKAQTSNFNSPALHALGRVQLSNADIEAKQSSAALFEGSHEFSLNNCNLKGNATAAVIIRSTLPDGPEGKASILHMQGGSMSSQNSPVLMVSNCAAHIQLDGVMAGSAQKSSPFLEARGYLWGSPQFNGAKVELQLSNCRIWGDIGVDSLSSLKLSLSKGTQLIGTIGGEGSITLSLEAGIYWELMGDAQIGQLSWGKSKLEDTLKGIKSNGFSIYYAPESNPQLKAKSYPLQGGGSLKPQPATYRESLSQR